jgi:phosphatidylinositol kinase/protein kinase (PI-3  family)
VPFRFTQNIRALVSLGGDLDTFNEYGVMVAKIGKSGLAELSGLLDSLLYDPLIEWKRGNSNIDEKKLMTFVKRRMSGAYDEINTTNSEKVFFHELLAVASSLENLSKMYFGWAPFI